MRAVRLHAPGEELRVEEIATPQPTGTAVRVRVGGAGVCRTDLHIVDGVQTRVDLPRVLGHEIAGWVDEAGPDAGRPLAAQGLSVGDPVVLHAGWGCRACADCASGNEQRCDRSVAAGFQADGGYAEAVLVPHPRYLVRLGQLDPGDAAPLADAGITAYRAVRRAEPWLPAAARVLVIGAGALGQFALQFLRLLPDGGDELRIGVREIDPARLERAASLGADVGLLAVEPDLTLAGLGGPADVVLDFVGTDGTLAHAAAVVAPGGAIVLGGEAGGHLSFGFDAPTIEAWMTTVAWGSLADLHDVVRLAAAGRVRWDTERLPLERAAEAHARLRRGEVPGRIVLVP